MISHCGKELQTCSAYRRSGEDYLMKMKKNQLVSLELSPLQIFHRKLDILKIVIASDLVN